MLIHISTRYINTSCSNYFSKLRSQIFISCLKYKMHIAPHSTSLFRTKLTLTEKIQWVTSLFGLVFRWVSRLSWKFNLNANFWTESKVRLAQRKLLLKTDSLFTSFLLSSARKIVNVTAVFTHGPRAQYLRPNRSQFVFYSAHAAIFLVAEYQLRQLPPQMFVYKQS